jgi:hypothetical protein
LTIIIVAHFLKLKTKVADRYGEGRGLSLKGAASVVRSCASRLEFSPSVDDRMQWVNREPGAES